MSEAKKMEMVTLEVSNSDLGKKDDKSGTTKQDFPIDQAQNILNIEATLGKVRHKLPKGSKYQLAENGDLIKSTSG